MWSMRRSSGAVTTTWLSRWSCGHHTDFDACVVPPCGWGESNSSTCTFPGSIAAQEEEKSRAADCCCPLFCRCVSAQPRCRTAAAGNITTFWWCERGGRGQRGPESSDIQSTTDDMPIDRRCRRSWRLHCLVHCVKETLHPSGIGRSLC